MVGIYFCYIPSPLDRLLLVSNETHLLGLYMQGQLYEREPAPDWIRNDELPILALAKQELTRYFDGRLTTFSVPYALRGTDFQKRVWTLLGQVPYGQTTTYGAVAGLAGEPDAARTVGHVIGMNPISVIVPCHRVVSSTGSLTGYNGGLERKRQLLELEAGKLRLPF